jgi:PEP-CTERM motif-containing protein
MNMKKFLMVIFALIIATSVATAGVGIQWSTAMIGYTHDAVNLTEYPTANGLLQSYSAIWQLIYAGADNIANSIANTPIQTGGPNGDYVKGDDVVWAERTIAMGGGTAPEDGTGWNDLFLATGGSVVYEDLGWSTAGFSYQRVFEGTPAIGSWYLETPLLALDTGYAGGGAPPQDSFVGTPALGFQATTQIVPEPATMGLLGLGALVMAFRRRRS